jgi:hypothetical protein
VAEEAAEPVRVPGLALPQQQAAPPLAVPDAGQPVLAAARPEPRRRGPVPGLVLALVPAREPVRPAARPARPAGRRMSDRSRSAAR